ncbi:MAG: DUF1622 domain-containing protein [Clostridia bacterium]|nr:DUF1622 domain-containing protein [Clostridia bacterium]
MDGISYYIDIVARIIEVIGVLTIAGGAIFILIRYTFRSLGDNAAQYSKLRQDLGKMILLGLEILVAADIIATVSTEPTMRSVLILAVIVLVRTFLSFSLQVELEGQWPWQQKEKKQKQI